MVYIKCLISLLLFLTVLIQPFTFVGLPEKIMYVGVIVPLLIQKIWTGHWIGYQNNQRFWLNVLFSVCFIASSVFVLDMFIMMAVLTTKYNSAFGENIFIILLFIINRLLFFYAVFYLWNKELFDKCAKIWHYLFKFLQFFYIILIIPVVVWFLYMGIIHVIIWST